MRLRIPEVRELSEKEGIKIKQRFLDDICKGRKTLELRTGFPIFQNISIGDHVKFHSGSHEVIVKIIAIRKHASMQEVIANEDVNRIAPNSTPEQRRELIARIFDQIEILKHGLLVFEFEKID